MTLLVTYFALALGLSFLCSILEAVLLSVTPSYVANLEEALPQLGAQLRALKEQVDRPLAAILSLNTISNTAGAAGVSAQAKAVYGETALAIATGLLTLSILVFSELIPKTLGAVHWRRIAPVAVPILRWMVRLTSPLVWLSVRITRRVEGEGEAPSVSREEIAALAKLGETQGALEAQESRVLVNLLRMSEIRARDIMTPRTVVYALPASTRVAELIDDANAATYSRIPVYRDGLDDVLGYVLKDDVLLRAARDELELPIAELVRPHTVVPDVLAVPALFEQLLGGREHLAIVVDEYGGVDGVVTMEDVIETLLGLEILAEADTVQDLREAARSRWKARRKALGSVPPPSEQG